MKRRTTHILAALALVVLTAAPLVAQAKHYKDIDTPPLPSWEIPKPERVVLDNGMVVFLLEDHELPLIQIAAMVRAGTRVAPGDKVGLGSIFGEVQRTGGTKNMSGDEIDEFLESLGASVETGMSRTAGSASMSCLKEDFDKVFSVFRDVLMYPQFAEEKIELAKVQERSAISRRNDDPSDLTRREFGKLIYGADSPYARHTEYATIDSVTRDDLRAFHRKYYKPNAIILGVTGDFDSKEMIANIRKTFASWKKGTLQVPESFAYSPKPNPGLYQIDKPDVTQSTIRIGHQGIKLDNPDYYAAQVMNQLFGLGFSSRIVQSIRSNKGLAYSVGSALTANYDYPGVFVMVVQTKSGTTVEAIEGLYDELDRLFSEPPTQEEVNLAKDQILNSFVFNFEDEGQIMNRYMNYEYFGYPLDFLEKYQKEVESVTPADVLRVAKKYLHKEDTTVLVTGKVEEFDRPLESITKGTKNPFEDRPTLVATIDVSIPEPAMDVPKATAASLDQGRQVLQRITDDLGGKGRVMSLSDMKLAAVRTMNTAQGAMDLKTTTWISYPDKLRVSMTTPMGDVTMVMNGEDGYMENPMGRQPMPDSARKEMADDLVRHPVNLARLYASGKAEGQYLGSESVAGRNCDIVLVTADGSTPFKVYADNSNGRILKISYQGSDMNGAPAETDMLLSDYRTVDGVPVPHKYVVMQGGSEAAVVNVDSVEINPAIEEGVFATGG